MTAALRTWAVGARARGPHQGEIMQMNRGLIHAIWLAVAGLVAAGGAAHAQLLTADVGLNPTFEQTGSGVAPTGGFFSGRAFFTNTTDFDAGTLTYGGPGSPAVLTPGSSPPSLTLTGVNSTFSGLQSDFPTGDYTFGLTGGTMGPIGFTITYAGDAYSNTPELTAASFSALQSANAAAPITIDFNTMVVSGNATEGANNIFFSVFDSSSAQVFSTTLSTDATSVTIGGGILSAGQSYTFDLLFDDRIVDSSGDFLKTQFYDTHTGGSFSTAAGAVPEPSTWAMLFMGFIGLGFAASLRGRKQGAAAIGR
jgi:PEP-CTERM motif